MIYPPSWPRGRSVLFAASLTLTLTACAGSTPARVELRRDLPPSPSYLQPVTVPVPRAGEDPLVIAARERAGRGEANRRITAMAGWYDAVRAEYAGEAGR